MKAVFIVHNQAYNEEITEILYSLGQKGFTRWQDIEGNGSDTGIPRFGSHAWPEMNIGILSMVDDDKVQRLLEELKKKDEESPMLGLRAFVWNIEAAY